MNPRAIFSKTGKGVQEASGKTSHLSRADRNVLKEIDGKTAIGEVAKKFEKLTEEKFDQLIQQLDKDGFIREVSSGETQPSAPMGRAAPPPGRAAAPPPSSGGGDDMDFTSVAPPKASAPPPKAPAVDLAAAARAGSERKANEQQTFDYKARQEAEAKSKAEAEAKARAAAEAKARAEAETKARAEAGAKAQAEAAAKAQAEASAKTQAETVAKAQAEADAKVRAAREAAVRMATEAKARAEAEAKAKADELNAKLEEERRAREDAERRAREAADQARREAEEKAKRDAEELRQRLEAEMKAKLEEERRKRDEEDRKRREEEDRRRKEEEERRAKEEAARRAREEEERKRREEEDRKRREDDERRRKEDEERRAKEEAERRARDEEDRRRKEEEERRAKEDAERRAREEQDRKRRDEEDRQRREEADRKRRDEDDRRRRDDEDRRKREEAEALARASQAAAPPAAPAAPTPAAPASAAPAPAAPAPAAPASAAPAPAAPAPAPPPPAAASGGFGDSLLADLDSFGKREEEEQKAKEEAERKAKQEAEHKAREEAERRAREEAEKKRREAEERRRKEEEERRAQEEAERRALEQEERRKHEEAERKRKAKEALAAKQAETKAESPVEHRAPEKAAKKAAPAADDDIGVTEDDLDMDDVKRDEKRLSAEARKAARERERAESRRGKDDGTATTTFIAPAPRKPVKWGKPVSIGLFVALIGGLGLLQVMPLSTADYQKAASEALGAPVSIRSAHLSLFTGVELKFDGVSVGDNVKINLVRGFPDVGSLFGAKKSFSRLELEGFTLSQGELAAAVLGKLSGDNFKVGRVVARQVKLDGPLTLPALDAEAVIAGDGSVQSLNLRGVEKLSVLLAPKGGEIGFEISAGSLALPFVPALTLSDFGMKGTATRQGVSSAEFDGRAFDGTISGTARMRWGANWTVEGEVRARGLKIAVFAPTLVSEGKVEGRGAYAMSGPAPAKLHENARLEGNFKIENGVLGSFDLTRALQSGGAQTGGRTIFNEMTAQGVYDKGAIQLRNIAVSSGAMNAGASLDIDANGGLAGRIVADVKTSTQALRATLNISGKIQDPVIRK